MTPRERVLRVLRGERPDRVPWFGDLDYWATAKIARGERPAGFKLSDDYLRWHRDLGVGFYLQGYFPWKAYPDFEERCWTEGPRRFREWATPKGRLREIWEWLPGSCSEGPIEHFVKSERDLAAMAWAYDHIAYEPDYALAERRREQVGDQGIVLAYLPKSPFMHLVALEAGIAAVTFAAEAAPDDFAETLAAMKRSHDRAARIAVACPAEALMIPENLSSEMVGKRFFNEFAAPVQREWVGWIRDAGKASFVHMDGTLRGLLTEQAAVGFTVIEAMTPAPVGDLAIEEWAGYVGGSGASGDVSAVSADASPLQSHSEALTPNPKAGPSLGKGRAQWNPKTILWGGIPGVYFTPLVSDDEFDRHVRRVLEVMRREPRYVLGVADQVPPDGLERRVRRVAELVERFGAYAG